MSELQTSQENNNEMIVNTEEDMAKKQEALNLLGKEALMAKKRGDIRKDVLFSIAMAALRKDMGIFEDD